MNTNTLRVFDTLDALDSFMREPLFTVPTRNTFPPYTVMQSKDGSEVRVDVALAGFTMEDVDVELSNGKLHIRGATTESSNDGWDIIHKGIAARKFDLSFAVNSNYEGDRAEMSDGILSVWLKRVSGFTKKITIRPRTALPNKTIEV